MSLTSVLRFLFSFRLIAASLLIWMLYSSQSIAWQQGNYRAYPAYTTAVNYNPYAYAQPRPNRYLPPAYPRYNYPTYDYPGHYRQNIQRHGYYPAQPKTSRPAGVNKRPGHDKPINAKPSKNFVSKQQFIDNLLPSINKENTRLRELHERIKLINSHLDKGIRVSDKAAIWLKNMAKKYRVNSNPLEHKQARQELLGKVDIIPPSLTLAQAANESAWGKSRFATEANNLFGIWTYDQSKGLKPLKRDSGKKHLVRIFENYGESVSYYMHTLNSHPAYKKLREIRRQQRNKRQAVNGLEMAYGLEKYSAKGNLYIKSIRSLIDQNKWTILDNRKLAT